MNCIGLEIGLSIAAPTPAAALLRDLTATGEAFSAYVGEQRKQAVLIVGGALPRNTFVEPSPTLILQTLAFDLVRRFPDRCIDVEELVRLVSPRLAARVAKPHWKVHTGELLTKN